MPVLPTPLWRRVREYPSYDVSNTGRFRARATGGEIARGPLGDAPLFCSIRGYYLTVNGWDMANRYFFSNNSARSIARASCLAG